MPSGLESLHKILKDEKRRKIIRLLNEKGSQGYTELLNALGIDSTGKLNYHLKILNELITKREDGQYVLTDKGKLAFNLL
jgi:predicted transcriptional regulator